MPINPKSNPPYPPLFKPTRQNPKSQGRRSFLQTSAAALSCMALSSCGWKLAEVKATPNLSGSGDKKSLDIYTWAGYTDDALLKRFTAETGIKVRADVYGSNDEMLAKIQASGGGEYSIIYPSDYTVGRMVELDLLAELDHSRLNGLENLFPRFRNPSADPELRHSIPTAWGTTVLIFNSEKLSPPPEDWNYLWEYQKQLSGRMTLLDDVREVMGATLKSLGYSYNSTDPQQLRQAYEKLSLLKPAIANFSTDAWQDLIIAGDLLLAMSYSSDAIKVVQENNKLQYVIPRSGSSVWTDTLVIPKTARNPDGAYAWINFLLQPDVAAQICERLKFATPNEAGFNQLPPQVRNNPGMFPPEEVLQKCESVAQIGQVAETYDRYWTQLRT